MKIVVTFCCSDTCMAHKLYSGFAMQNTFMWTVVFINELSKVLQSHSFLNAILLASLSIFAHLPTLRSNIFSTRALLAFWVVPDWFSIFSSQIGYLNSKLVLKWDSPFKGIIRVLKLQGIDLFYYLLELRKLANSNDVHKSFVGALFWKK